MPSIYTHQLFGSHVLKQLPEDMGKTIKKNMKYFQIGLQGPDILFYYHPLFKLKANRFGYKQHHTPEKYFLEPILPYLRKLGTDSPEYAYILGHICHFILDSECHEYVNRQAKEPSFNHLVMEIEFDRYLMKKNGLKPLSFPIHDLIPGDRHTIRTISNIYNHFGITAKQVASSLKGMHFYKKLFTTGKTLRRAVIRLAMKLSMHYRELEGHMMSLIPKSNAGITNKEMLSSYKNALKSVVPLMVSFHNSILSSAPVPLDKRFSMDFHNNAESAS